MLIARVGSRDIARRLGPRFASRHGRKTAGGIAERGERLELGPAAVLAVGGIERGRDRWREVAVVFAIDPQHRRRRAARQLARRRGQEIGAAIAVRRHLLVAAAAARHVDERGDARVRRRVIGDRPPAAGRLADEHHALRPGERQRRGVVDCGGDVASAFQPGPRVIDFRASPGRLRPVAAGRAVTAAHRRDDDKAAFQEPARRLAVAPQRNHQRTGARIGRRAMRDDGDARRRLAGRAAHPCVQQVMGPADIERDPVDLHAPRAFGAVGWPRHLLRRRDAEPAHSQKQAEPPPHRFPYRLEIAGGTVALCPNPPETPNGEAS
jgi:hypothetical protein